MQILLIESWKIHTFIWFPVRKYENSCIQKINSSQLCNAKHKCTDLEICPQFGWLYFHWQCWIFGSVTNMEMLLINSIAIGESIPHTYTCVVQFVELLAILRTWPAVRLAAALTNSRLSVMQSIIICMHFRSTLSGVFSCLFLCVGFCAPLHPISDICSLRSLHSSPVGFSAKRLFFEFKIFHCLLK